MFVYAQARQSQTLQEKIGTDDWRTILQQEIVDSQNRLTSSRIPEEWQRLRKINIEIQQFHLDHDINPFEPGGPTFAKEFMEQSTSLFLPLLVMIVATDLVSGEHGAGTIKLLLSRPVRRWKILLSKLLSLSLFVSLIISLLLAVSYVISGIAFGFSGWTTPILTGFRVIGNQLDTSQVGLIPLWQYLIMSAGLTWFVGVIVGIIALMISVLVRSTAAGMGIMLATIISGTVLRSMASSWEGAKYLFMLNLDLTQYLSGGMPPIPGMNLAFSITVLASWALVALIIAFVTFNRQDMLA